VQKTIAIERALGYEYSSWFPDRKTPP
jgi:hypothetical protein